MKHATYGDAQEQFNLLGDENERGSLLFWAFTLLRSAEIVRYNGAPTAGNAEVMRTNQLVALAMAAAASRLAEDEIRLASLREANAYLEGRIKRVRAQAIAISERVSEANGHVSDVPKGDFEGLERVLRRRLHGLADQFAVLVKDPDIEAAGTAGGIREG